MRRVVEVDEDEGRVSILINNILITFYGKWRDEKLEMRVVSKEKPGAQVHDPGALDVPRAAFAKASAQAAKILRERREKSQRAPKQLSIPGV